MRNLTGLGLVLLALGAACNRDGDTDGPAIAETGWWSQLDADGNCVARVTDSVPEDGATGWYWRRGPTFKIDEDVGEAERDVIYGATVLGPEGQTIASHLEWTGGTARVALDDALIPSSAHTLLLQDCEGIHEVGFTTSGFGTPLDDDLELVGRTYVFDMSEATWTEPANFGSVIQLYFTEPVLIGVRYSGEDGIDLLGSMGWRTQEGEWRQYVSQPTWDFPLADFSEAPYFAAATDKVKIRAEGVDVDIWDFKISGTFSSNGERLGGVTISGLGNTMNMGELLGKKGDTEAVCDLAATWGVVCEPCPEGGLTTCVRLAAEDASGTFVPGLEMRQSLE